MRSFSSKATLALRFALVASSHKLERNLFSLKLRLLTLCLLLSGLAYAAGTKNDYVPVSSGSSVRFSIKHLTNRANGKFSKFDGKLQFAKTQPEQSTVKFAIDVASVDTGNSSRDSSIKGDDYFNTQKYPKMTFESKVFKPLDKDHFMVTGPLTIKGHSKNISVPVTLTKTEQTWASGEEVLRFKGAFEVDRTEFGVGEASSLLGSQVSVVLDLEFRGAK